MDSDHVQRLADTPMLDASVRVHLTGLALQGLLAAHSDEVRLPKASEAAEWAVEFADATLLKLAERTTAPAA